MDLFSDIITAVQSDMTIGDESPLFPLATVKSVINRAYIKSAALFLWPETEDAKKTSTENGADYYDFPDDWQSDSMWRVEIDGVMYGEDPDGSPLAFRDYLKWKEDNPTSTEKKWSVQKKRFFVTPTPTTNGDNNISVWGHLVVPLLSAVGDATIFSYIRPECNIAIELEAVAILKAKEQNEKVAQGFYSPEAKGILALAWSKVKKAQPKYAKNLPILDVPNFFPDGVTAPVDPDDIGRF